jgi:hypothetical protein
VQFAGPLITAVFLWEDPWVCLWEHNLNLITSLLVIQITCFPGPCFSGFRLPDRGTECSAENTAVLHVHTQEQRIESRKGGQMGQVAHACHPSYSGGRGRRITIQDWPCTKNQRSKK